MEDLLTRRGRIFVIFSRGSMFETRTWLLKAKNRKLIDETKHNEFYQKIATLHFKLNVYIKSLREKI